jgi:hypothetical protein
MLTDLEGGGRLTAIRQTTVTRKCRTDDAFEGGKGRTGCHRIGHIGRHQQGRSVAAPHGALKIPPDELLKQRLLALEVGVKRALGDARLRRGEYAERGL